MAGLASGSKVLRVAGFLREPGPPPCCEPPPLGRLARLPLAGLSAVPSSGLHSQLGLGGPFSPFCPSFLSFPSFPSSLAWPLGACLPPRASGPLLPTGCPGGAARLGRGPREAGGFPLRPLPPLLPTPVLPSGEGHPARQLPSAALGSCRRGKLRERGSWGRS